jgi:glycosyltransferase involved in cell wall biosynthesis
VKILILYRHFWPDSPPYAAMLRSIAAHLVAAGHEVTIWAEMPVYKQSDGDLSPPRREVLDGIQVERFRRLPLWHRSGFVRTLAKLAYVPRIIAKALTAKAAGYEFDLVWTATIPPVLQGWCGRTVARIFAAKFLYHCQDLYPEIAVQSGMITEGGLLHRMGKAIEGKTRASADMLVTLSADMEATAAQLRSPRQSAIVNNFLLESFSQQRSSSAKTVPSGHSQHISSGDADESTIRIVFAGNVGRFQGLSQFVEGFLDACETTPLHLTILGEGRALDDLKRQASGSPHIRFRNHLPFSDAAAVIAAHDFGLVALEPELYRYAYPSKTLTYFGLGLPVLAMVEPESELARLIEANGLGSVFPARSPKNIAAALCQLGRGADALPVLKANAARHYAERLATPARLNDWGTLINGLSANRAAEPSPERREE